MLTREAFDHRLFGITFWTGSVTGSQPSSACAAPLLLVRDGRMLKKNMRRELIRDDELMAQLREQGITHLDEVKRCYLEGDGHVSVIKRSSMRRPRRASLQSGRQRRPRPTSRRNGCAHPASASASAISSSLRPCKVARIFTRSTLDARAFGNISLRSSLTWWSMYSPSTITFAS